MSSTPSEMRLLPYRAGALADRPMHVTALVGLVLCIVAFWMLQHPYEGIVHDSVLYAFAALARLRPESLGHDVYLTLGVQDRYTVFSPIGASVIGRLGLERGAALIVFAAQAAFFACGWLLARRLLPAAEALLSVALLVILPAIYGDAHIFSYVESFMTPRLPSEALVLACLAAALGERYLLAGACLLIATALHPIMAFAGLMLLALLYVGVRRPVLSLALGAAGLAVLTALAWAKPFGPVARFDSGWFDLLYFRGTYLFPSMWPLDDWAHATVPLTTLAVGAITASQPRIRSLCVAALALGVTGIVVSLIGADLLRVVLIAQAQPWRWLWLSNALAVILTPAIFQSCWRDRDAKRSAALLLASAWVCIDGPYAPIIDVFAIGTALAAGYLKDPRHARLIAAGAWMILGLSMLVLAEYVLRVLKLVALVPPDQTLYDSNYLLELRRWKAWQAGGIVPACIFVAAWWAATRREGVASALGVFTLGVILCGAFAHFAWNAWTRVELPRSLYAEFSSWRDAIPRTAEVLWADTAFPTWYLLERPSYWSRTQMAASVFSEPLARELARREWVVRAIRASTHDPRQILVRTCEDNPKLGFYVSSQDAGPSRYPPIRNPKGSDSVWLYRCADYRK